MQVFAVQTRVWFVCVYGCFYLLLCVHRLTQHRCKASACVHPLCHGHILSPLYCFFLFLHCTVSLLDPKSLQQMPPSHLQPCNERGTLVAPCSTCSTAAVHSAPIHQDLLLCTYTPQKRVWVLRAIAALCRQAMQTSLPFMLFVLWWICSGL